MAIWRQGPYGGQANPLVVRREDACGSTVS
jgi:hypothetical protein